MNFILSRTGDDIGWQGTPGLLTVVRDDLYVYVNEFTDDDDTWAGQGTIYYAGTTTALLEVEDWVLVARVAVDPGDPGVTEPDSHILDAISFSSDDTSVMVLAPAAGLNPPEAWVVTVDGTTRAASTFTQLAGEELDLGKLLDLGQRPAEWRYSLPGLFFIDKGAIYDALTAQPLLEEPLPVDDGMRNVGWPGYIHCFAIEEVDDVIGTYRKVLRNDPEAVPSSISSAFPGPGDQDPPPAFWDPTTGAIVTWGYTLHGGGPPGLSSVELYWSLDGTFGRADAGGSLFYSAEDPAATAAFYQEVYFSGAADADTPQGFFYLKCYDEDGVEISGYDPDLITFRIASTYSLATHHQPRTPYRFVSVAGINEETSDIEDVAGHETFLGGTTIEARTDHLLPTGFWSASTADVPDIPTRRLVMLHFEEAFPTDVGIGAGAASLGDTRRTFQRGR